MPIGSVVQFRHAAILVATLLCATLAYPDIRSGVPAGFRDLVPDVPASENIELDEGLAYAELLVDGTRVGDIVVSYARNTLTFDDPDAVAALIPQLSRGIELLDRLQTRGAACIRLTAADCAHTPGRLTIAYEPRTPRLSIYRPVRFLAPPEPVQPSHTSTAGLISGFALRVSGRQDEESPQQQGSLTMNLLAGRGAASLFVDGVMSSSGRYFSRRAGLARYLGRHRLSAGLLQAEASEHFSQIDLMGVELGTAERTIAANAGSSQTPLVLFLEEDSQVDVLRDGELLLSRFFRSGTVTLPTRSFPSGSYNLTLMIRSTSGAIREESRFFFRSSGGLQAGRTAYLLQMGYTRDAGAASSRFEEGRLPYAALRLTRPTASGALLGGRLGTLDSTGFFELYGERTLGQTRLRLSGLTTVDGGVSLSALLGGTYAGVSFSSSFRHSELPTLATAFRSRTERFTEANITASGELPAGLGRLSANLRSRQTRSSGSRNAWGVSWSRPFSGTGTLNRGRVGLTYQNSVGGHRLLVHFHVGARRQRSAFNVQASHAERHASNGTRTSFSSGSLQSTWWSGRDARAPWTLTTRMSHDSEGRRQIGLSGRRLHEHIDLEGEVRHEQSDTGSVVYSGTLNSTLAVSAAGVSWSSRRSVEGGVLLDTRNVPRDVELIASVNGRRHTLQPGEVRFQPLPAFRSSDVAFRPIGRSSIGYDNSRVRVLPFPGNLTVLRPELYRSITVFGRLVGTDRKPIQGRIELTTTDRYVTEEDGYFVMDLRLERTGNALHVDTGSASCLIHIPHLGTSNSAYEDLGDVSCTPAGAE